MAQELGFLGCQACGERAGMMGTGRQIATSCGLSAMSRATVPVRSVR